MIFLQLHGFFIGANVKNGLKVKQLAKQPPKLKTLIDYMRLSWSSTNLFILIHKY